MSLRIPRLNVLVGVLFFAALHSMAQIAIVQGVSTAHISRPSRRTITDQKIVAPYWTLEPGWNTQLEVRNNLAHDEIAVTPVLRKSDGAELALSPVKVAAEQAVSLDLQALAGNSMVGDDAYGSLLLRYKSKTSSSVYAAVLVQRIGHPFSFHFDAYPVDPRFSSGTRESVWWLPQATSDGYLIISNFSSRPVNAQPVFTDGKNRVATALKLAPFQTERISIRDAVQAAGIKAKQGGVQVSLGSDAGSVYVAQVLFDEISEFSALMKVFERNQDTQAEIHVLRAPLLALNTPDPMLGYPEGTVLRPVVFVRNATGSALNVDALLNWKSAKSTGSIPFKMAPLAPEETRVVDLASLKGMGLPSDAYWANVELTYSGKIGDVVPLAASYDETTRYGVQSPFSDSISFLWKGGMWHVDGQHNTLITTGNSIENDKPAEVAIKLFYGTSGVYELPTTVLAPGKQTWIDVGKLIRDQVPDRRGQLLPPGVMEGSYEIKDLKNHQVGYLYEGKLITDKTFGHATYGCALCCEYGGVGYDGFYLTPNPLYGTVGGGGQYNAYALNQCTGVDDPVDAYTYSSSNTSVATVTVAGHVSMLSPGTSTVTGFAKLQSTQNPSCRPQTYQAQSPTTVACAVPTNYHQTQGYDAGGGVLQFVYAWSSSTGTLSDLAGCTVREYVTYPGSSPFIWPSPPYVSTSTTFPVTLGVGGDQGIDSDNHGHPSFKTPYTASTITATQYYQYVCPCANGGQPVNVMGPISITRQVSFVSPSGKWDYTITKSNVSASTLLPWHIWRLSVKILMTLCVLTMLELGHVPSSSSCTPSDHEEWLSKATNETLSVKPGVTREEFLKVYNRPTGFFTPSRLEGTYAYKGSQYIRVDVEFSEAPGTHNDSSENAKDILRSISKPYLSTPTYD